MYILTIFLLLATCRLSTPIGIYNKENSRLQRGFQSDEFFQKIRDWFANLRNGIQERLFTLTDTTPQPSLSTETWNFDEFDLRNRFDNREWIPLNLSALSFNPNEDWGFRIRNWYFIRKGYKNQNTFNNNFDQLDYQLLNSIQPKNSAEAESRETFDVTEDSGITESILTASTINILSIHNVTSTTTREVDLQTAEQIDSYEYSSPKTNEQMDNETDNDFVRKGSVEVLMG
ncbi:hypothetical protein ANTPLA_LOCUS10718 [Anthophora plagiata]